MMLIGESSNIAHKDMIYDIISIFIHELSELNKLSIQDHHYPYEIITEGIRRVRSKLDVLENLLGHHSPHPDADGYP